MLALAHLALCLLGAADGEVAFLRGANTLDRTVRLLDLATGETRAVGTSEVDGPPRWSADGALIVHETSKAPGVTSLRVVTPGGEEAARIDGPGGASAREPAWAPRGRRIAFAAAEPPGEGAEFPYRGVHVHDLETGETAPWGGGAPNLMAPRWVRAESLRHFLWVKEQEGIETGLGALDVTQLDDGLLLAAVGLTEEQDRPTLSIFLVTPDAAIPIPPVFLPSRGTYEEWSLAPNPRTEFLAFETNDGADREIYMFTKHGPANLTNHRAADWNPVWDPTGKWMLFESYRGGRRGVYRNYPDTRRIRPLAVSPVYDNWAPCWSPDGQSVVFVSNRGGNPDLFLIDREGDNLRQLTDHAADDLAPAWRPEARE